MKHVKLILCLGIAGAALALACDSDNGKRAASSCSSDAECEGGGCYESTCYSACQGQEDCADDQVCEPSTTVDAARMSLCVPASAVIQCEPDDPQVIACPVGDWRASFTRASDEQVDCVVDGMLTQSVILSFTRGEDGSLGGTFTSTNNPNPEQGDCFDFTADFTRDDMAFEWDEASRALDVIMSSRSECEGVEVAWPTNYGLIVTADACCQGLTGQSWFEPADPCDEASGRTSEAIQFQRFEHTALNDMD